MTGEPQVNLPSGFGKLPLRASGFFNCPAIPFSADASGNPDPRRVADTMAKLKKRGGSDAELAYKGLSTTYTIGGHEATAYKFLYDKSPLARLALDDPEQFTLPWTTYGRMYRDEEPLAPVFAEWLTNSEKATRSFWPTIAGHGIPYNLLVLEKVRPLVYMIDLSILASLEPVTQESGEVRFVPGAQILLEQDPGTKDLTPVSILLSTDSGRRKRLYLPDDPAWIYALQAAKAAVTVWGIWLGHVYQWHVVTSAMIMTMATELGPEHRLWPLIAPQSESVFDFDFVLLNNLWDEIAPPTPLSDHNSLLRLWDRYAAGREFFHDDPLAALDGIELEDFSKDSAWDKYPIAGFLSDIYRNTADYVDAVVGDLYTSDAEVARDTALQAWIAASRDPLGGNVRGLPDVRTREELARVVTSLLYRVNAHGAGALVPTVHPVLSFMANFPPCLQSAELPEPGRTFGEKELLEFLPRTGTLGQMTTFYFTFAYSPPYVPLIPGDGIRTRHQFPIDRPRCNDALYRFREQTGSFIDDYITTWNAELAKLRGTRPGSIPGYAKGQHQQWSRSIEI